MTNFLQLVLSLREQMSATLSRSDILKPLAWLIAILVGGLGTGFALSAPNWFLMTMTVFLGIVLALYVFAYIYCLLRDRDALRSERYSLHKLAIQHGVYGDNLSGLRDAADATKQIGSAPEVVKSGTDHG